MLELRDKDWERMKWDIQNLPFTKRCLSEHPELGNRFLEYRDVSTVNLSTDILVRYIVLNYHRFSPFVEKCDNPMERKIHVLHYLKVKDKDGVYPEDVQRVLKNDYEAVGKMIIQFVKFENSLDYFAFTQTMETWFTLNEQLGTYLTSAKDSKDTADIMIKMDKVDERRDSLANKLFQRDKDLKNFIGSVLVEEGRRKNKIVPEDYI